ncbi:unnamed protein product [Discosporangium mesarthrocarpum]
MGAVWSHDMFSQVSSSSPPRTRLPAGYKPQQETWASRAGGVYLPTKTKEET